MKRLDVIHIFNKAGALLKGHFVLSSGLHSEKYLQCAIILSQPRIAETLCKNLAAKFKGKKIEAVIGPAYGGILVAYELARALKAKAFFTERKDGIMQLRRNFKLRRGERVLVCEDVVTTGKSVNELIDTIKPLGPKIIGVAALIDRGAKARPFGKIPLTSLAKIEIKTYLPENCPLCNRGVPLVKPGSR